MILKAYSTKGWSIYTKEIYPVYIKLNRQWQLLHKK
jgi:hypothetical protein